MTETRENIKNRLIKNCSSDIEKILLMKSGKIITIINELTSVRQNISNKLNVKLDIRKNDNIINISTIDSEYGNYINLSIKIDLIKNTSVINTLNRSDDISGTIYMYIAIGILELFNIKNIYLKDVSEYIYPKKNPLIKFPLNILSLLKSKRTKYKTYYMKFGFEPYQKNETENIQTKINKILDYLYLLDWNDFDKLFENGEIIIKNIKNNIKIREEFKKFIDLKLANIPFKLNNLKVNDPTNLIS